VPFVILGLLLGGPLSLYDLRKRFSAGISLFYSSSFGGLQRALGHLIDSGGVTVEVDPGNTRGRKLYRVTDAGRSQWHEWMLEPLPRGADTETLLLAKVFLLGRLEASADRALALARVREAAEASLSELRALAADVDAQTTGLPSELADIAAYQRATLDYGLRSAQLALEWIDELTGELP
jgi:DNA-binding PadR family transcriptional regulator